MANWITYANPQLSMTLQYPNPTPLGHPVNISEKSSNISYRIHLISDESSEVYFEIGRYHTLPIRDAVNLFQKELKENISQVQIGQVEATTFATRSAYRLTARWPEKERTVTFFDLEGIVYRIIYDPTSAINHQILETLIFN